MGKVLVLGAKKSGIAAVKLLLSKGMTTYIYDDNFNSNTIDYCAKLGALIASIDIDISVMDFCVISPGVPTDHSIAVRCRNAKINVVSELELGFINCSAKLIAVTGTNGKTTICNLIHHICAINCRSFLVGNVGNPLCDEVFNIKKDDCVVCEVSSFQLENVTAFNPYIAAVVNITADHLNRHHTMDEYIRCKKQITINQTNDEYLVLNADDSLVSAIKNDTNAKVFYFSLTKKVKGCYVKKNDIIYFDGNSDRRICKTTDIKLIGQHNVSNVLCAIICCILYGISIKNIVEGVCTFVAVSHRLETVGVYNNIKYINDSKATNIDSTLIALKCFNNSKLCLIVGGSDKGYEFDKLIEAYPSNIVKVIYLGATTKKLVEASERLNYKNYCCVKDMFDATQVATDCLLDGGVVLLSPACASFDMFDNYEHRGNVFAQIVKEHYCEK